MDLPNGLHAIRPLLCTRVSAAIPNKFELSATETAMKNHPDQTTPRPDEELGNPNDDGCVLGTAGRDEDPNATTDWDHDTDSAGNVMTPEDRRGLPGYPDDSGSDMTPVGSTPKSDAKAPQKNQAPDQDNEGAD